MALIFFARPYSFGVPVPLVRANLLQKLRRSTGSRDYMWLHDRIRALTEATLYVEARREDGSAKYRIGTSSAFHILRSFDYDERTKTYYFSLDPRWVQLFSNREYSLIDWEKRMKIRRGLDMAKTLQRLVATSSDSLQPYSLDWLKNKMAYGGRMRDFRTSLIDAVQELVRVEVITYGNIGVSKKGMPQLVLSRRPSG